MFFEFEPAERDNIHVPVFVWEKLEHFDICLLPALKIYKTFLGICKQFKPIRKGAIFTQGFAAALLLTRCSPVKRLERRRLFCIGNKPAIVTIAKC